MLNRLRRWMGQFLRNTSTINQEPLNRVSLIVIILVDIFILANVFAGLDDISRWFLSPTETYPCYSQWADYRQDTSSDKNYDLLQQILNDTSNPSPDANPQSFRDAYKQAEVGHLGQVSPICLDYGVAKDQVNQPANRQLMQRIDTTQNAINTLDANNRQIRDHYDSTLLEKIAGQPQGQSINQVRAEEARQRLDANNRKIAGLKQEITGLKIKLLQKPESVNFFKLLATDTTFKELEANYQRVRFWHPSIQLGFQFLFLLPLIFLGVTVYRFAQGRSYGLVSLISWHLLVIFCVPLVLKIFEFLQVGILAQFLFELLTNLLGGLLFLVSYLYILLIPLLGFGIIKFFQKFIFNPKLQIDRRVQKSQCVKCARKIRAQDQHCPHCGYGQYLSCPHCQQPTYRFLPYCKHCGQGQT